jgi:hypothetical protein
MWSLHPFINDEIMQQAWKYIHWTILFFLLDRISYNQARLS